MKINKKELFKMAWELLDNFTSFAKALTQAWKILKLKAKMLVGNVAFKFRKAVGTLNFTYESKGTGKSSPSDSMVCMEEGKGIRSCKLVNIL